MSIDPLVENPVPSSAPSPVASAEGLPSEVSLGGYFAGLLSVQGLLDRARSMKGLLRLKPFDTATEQGRSRERYRRAAVTSLTSVLAKGVTVIISLITVRLTIRYLGTERYGLWMTITSVVALLMFADFGIGNGLLSAIAEARGRDDTESVHKYVSSAFFVLLGIAALLLGLFGLAFPFVPWPRVFNVSSLVAAREAGPAVMVFVLFFLLNIPLDVVQRVQRGHQEGYATNFWTVIGSLAGLGGLLIVMQRKGGLPWLILAILGGQIFAILGNWVQEFGFARPELLPKWAYWDTAAARKIVNTGVMFFLLQSLGVFTIPLDNIIIAQILGPAAVSQYAVPFRLFLLVMSVAAMFVAPLWPAYGEALARGEVKWVRSTLYRSLGYSALIFGPVVVGLAGFGRGIMHIWVGKQVEPTQALLLGMAVWTMLAVLGNAISTFLCGVNALKAYLEIAALQAIANVVLKIVMAKAFGLPGVIWAAVFAALLGLGVLSVYAHKGSLRGIMFPPRRSVRGEG